MNARPRTVVYLPDTPDRELWERLAAEYCERNQYEIVGLVVRRDGDDQWAEIVGMLAAGAADLLVVGRRDHLPPNRLPRVEIITEHGEPQSGDSRRRGRGAR